jgi:hypothetical protein
MKPLKDTIVQRTEVKNLKKNQRNKTKSHLLGSNNSKFKKYKDRAHQDSKWGFLDHLLQEDKLLEKMNSQI